MPKTDTDVGTGLVGAPAYAAVSSRPPLLPLTTAQMR
jgi:hypothetical protein